jgi:hypothetical protein
MSGMESKNPARELFEAALAAKSPVKYLTDLRRVSDLVDARAVMEAQGARIPAGDKARLLSEVPAA